MSSLFVLFNLKMYNYCTSVLLILVFTS